MNLRRILSLCVVLVLLTGCKGEESLLAHGVSFRGSLVAAGGCSFRAHITADYGPEIQNFTLDCQSDGNGIVHFSVVDPETIAGITGTMEGEEGTITYDGLQLAFPLLVYDRISPVAAPAFVVHCWLKEFILSAGIHGEQYRVTYEKKIQDKVLLIDTYFEKDIPISAELCYNGYRILNIQITDFSFH